MTDSFHKRHRLLGLVTAAILAVELVLLALALVQLQSGLPGPVPNFFVIAASLSVLSTVLVGLFLITSLAAMVARWRTGRRPT
jgi:hypothetical protein